MSFARFRESGEFSDLLVIVDETEFHLHRFPLLAKSNFIYQQIRDSSPKIGNGAGDLKLNSFPGGSQIFALVADFCYGMKIAFTPDNIIQLRTAAEFLQMFGTENLVEISHKFLEDMIKSAKMSRSAGTIVKLLEECYHIGQLAEQAKLIDWFIEAIASCYVQPPSKFSSPIGKRLGDVYDERLSQQMYTLPFMWFAKLISQVKDKGLEPSRLADLIIPFIKQAVESDVAEKNEDEDQRRTKRVPKRNLLTLSECDLIRDTKSLIAKEEEKEISLRTMVILTLLPELPAEAFNHEFFNIDHIIDILGEIVSCDLEESQRVLRCVTCPILERLTSSEIASILPDLMFDVLRNTYHSDKTQGKKLATFLEIYLTEKNHQKCLRTETFKLLINSVPMIFQENFDNLFEILESLLQIEKDSLSESEKESLLDAIDWTLISREALERAMDKDIIPTKYIAKAALNQCKKLQETMNTLQEKETSKEEREEAEKLDSADEMVSPISPFNFSPTENDFGEKDMKKQLANNSPSMMMMMIHGRTNSSSNNSSVYSNATLIEPSAANNTTTNYTFRALNFDDSSLEEDLDFKMEPSLHHLDQRLKKSSNSLTSNSIYNLRQYSFYTRRY